MTKKEDFALESVLKFYGVLCETIEKAASKPNPSNKITESAFFDYINNYLIYATPFIFLKDESEFNNKDQLVHDCYLTTKEIIENSTISPIMRSTLIKPLHELSTYTLISKSYKTSHLNAYIPFFKYSLSIDENKSDTDETLQLKDLVRPLSIFLITGFPLKHSANSELENDIQILDKYIDFQVRTLFDIFFTLKLIQESKTKIDLVLYTNTLIENLFIFLDKYKYPQEVIIHCSKLLARIYTVLFSGQENTKKIDIIMHTLSKSEELQLSIDNIKKNSRKGQRKPTGELKNEPRYKPKRAASKTNTPVSRKLPATRKRAKGRST
jgi:hypothetical protein